MRALGLIVLIAGFLTGPALSQPSPPTPATEPGPLVRFTAQVTDLQWGSPRVVIRMHDDQGRPWIVEGGSPSSMLRAGVTRDLTAPDRLVLVAAWQTNNQVCDPTCHGTLKSLEHANYLVVRDARLDPAVMQCFRPREPGKLRAITVDQKQVSEQAIWAGRPDPRLAVQSAFRLSSDDAPFTDIVSVSQTGAVTAKGAYIGWQPQMSGATRGLSSRLDQFTLETVGSNCRRVEELSAGMKPQLPGYRFLSSVPIPGGSFGSWSSPDLPERVGVWVRTEGPSETLIGRFDAAKPTPDGVAVTVLGRVPLQALAMSVAPPCRIDSCEPGIGGITLMTTSAAGTVFLLTVRPGAGVESVERLSAKLG